MNKMLFYIKKYVLFFIAAVASMIIAISVDMFNPYLKKMVVDDVMAGGNLALFKWILLGFGAITVIRSVFGYIKEYLFDLTSSKIVQGMRKDLFDHIQSLSFSFFDGINTGELMSRIKEDMDSIWRALSFGAMLFIEQAIYFIVASVLLFTLNWKLAAVSLVTMPLIAYIARKLEKKVGEVYEKISDQGVVLNTTAQENIAGVRLVKAFGREKYEIRKFLEQNRRNYELNMEQAGIFARYHPLIEFLSNIVVVLVTAAGGFLVIGGEMSIGTLVAFSSYIYMLIWPMRLIGWLTNILSQCHASLKKIDVIFNEKPVIKSPAAAVTPEKFEGRITFENVSLEYNGVPVLKNINIDAKPGTTVAIMGATGSGKSSVVNLIGRYYDCTSGNIYFDGINIKDMDVKTLRRKVAVVMQDTFLFSETIEENIKFGSPDVTKEEFSGAVRDSRVRDFVIQMPDGYNTVIGERGIGLSGGQKQRISLARALVKDSIVLILDDATSALDMETEHRIQKKLEDRKGKTTFIIAHRVSAVKNADEIIILDNGEIVERGTHGELLELRGRYYDTYCEQMKGILDMQEKEVV